MAVTESKAPASAISRTLSRVRCTSELTRLRSRHGCDRGTDHARRTGVEADRLHPLRVQLRHRGAPRRRGRPAVRAHPRRQGPPVVAGLHLREGAAPRPLPEPGGGPPRSTPGAGPGERSPTRCAGAPTARSRSSTGTPPSPRSPAGSARSATRTAARRSSTTAAAGRGTTSAARTPRARCTRSARRYRSNALAQEKTGEFWVNGKHARHQRPRRLRALRGRPVRRQEPVAVPRHPARPHDAEGDRPRPRPGDDRHRPASHRDRRAGRLPPAGAARHRRLADRRRWRRPSSTSASSTAAWLAEHATGARRRRRRAARRRHRRRTARSAASTRTLVRAAARRIGRGRRAWPCSRTSASR